MLLSGNRLVVMGTSRAGTSFELEVELSLTSPSQPEPMSKKLEPGKTLL